MVSRGEGEGTYNPRDRVGIEAGMKTLDEPRKIEFHELLGKPLTGFLGEVVEVLDEIRAERKAAQPQE